MTDTFRIRVREKSSGRYMDMPRADAAGRTAYEAASNAPRVALWQGSAAGPTSAIARDLPKLRTRSRERRRNDGVADAGLQIMAANVVGTGIKPQWKTSDRGLNKALAELWLDWTDFSDPFGKMDFYGQQMMAFIAMMEGGDVFARLRTRKVSDGLPVPLQVQLLESEHCPVEKTEQYGQNRIINGVEFNGIGQPSAYWLYRDHPGDLNYLFSGSSNLPVRVTAEDVVHLSMMRRPSNVRGEPALARSLIDMYDLDQFNDAVKIRLKLGNLFAGFISPGAEGKFGWTDDQGNSVPVQQPDSGGRANATLEPGHMQVLGPGDNITFSEPPEAGTSYEVFNKIQLRKIASSIGLTYEQLSGDYTGVNDRTWRSAMNEFYRRLETIQLQVMAFQFCRPICQRFVELAILNGTIKVPASVPEYKALRPAWIAPVRPYINPTQDVEAEERAIKAGLKSRAQAVSERGGDIEDLDEEVARDMEREKKLKISFETSVGASAKVAPKKPAPSDPNDPNADPNDPNPDGTGGSGDNPPVNSSVREALDAVVEVVRATNERPAQPINITMPAVRAGDVIVSEIKLPEMTFNATLPKQEPAAVNVQVTMPEIGPRSENIEVTAYDEIGRIKNMRKDII